MKKWIRYKSLLRRARIEQQKQQQQNQEEERRSNDASTTTTGRIDLPTPAQRARAKVSNTANGASKDRQMLVLSSSQVHNTQRLPVGAQTTDVATERTEGEKDSQSTASQSQSLPSLLPSASAAFGSTQAAAAAEAEGTGEAGSTTMWADFDLDAEINLDAIDVAQAWGFAENSSVTVDAQAAAPVAAVETGSVSIEAPHFAGQREGQMPPSYQIQSCRL